MNLGIIGAGQLGSRHLQALALIEKSLNIYVVDSNIDALRVSEERFNEVDIFKNKNLFLEQSISTLPESLEFVVIATTSRERLSVLKSLLENRNIKYILLEKFLFPKEEDYFIAQQLILEKKVTVYINCTRRMWNGYKLLKKELSLAKQMELIVNGADWNMASNSIHFLDLFHFLTPELSDVSIITKDLDNDIINNKRQGYVEFTGQLIAEMENGNRMSLNCNVGSNDKFLITIKTDQTIYNIDEQKQEINNNGAIYEFPQYYQSGLTNIVFEKLIKDGQCDLTPFNESMKYHLLLLKSFNKFLDGREGIIT